VVLVLCRRGHWNFNKQNRRKPCTVNSEGNCSCSERLTLLPNHHHHHHVLRKERALNGPSVFLYSSDVNVSDTPNGIHGRNNIHMNIIIQFEAKALMVDAPQHSVEHSQVNNLSVGTFPVFNTFAPTRYSSVTTWRGSSYVCRMFAIYLPTTNTTR
jgi:hypothetical protein